MKQYIFKIADFLLALPFIIFGLNKFIGFASVAPPSDQIAQSFLGTMFTSYLFQFVAIVEIIGGGLLMVDKTKKLGFILLLPITTNIIWFHLAHDLPGNGIWLFTLLMTIISGIGMKEKLSNSLKSTLS